MTASTITAEQWWANHRREMRDREQVVQCTHEDDDGVNVVYDNDRAEISFRNGTWWCTAGFEHDEDEAYPS